MSALNWNVVSDGGVLESLTHAILYAEDPGTILFGRPGKDAGQDARSADGSVVYQVKYRQGMTMDIATNLALDELRKIECYQMPEHANARHWREARHWVLVANMPINPNDDSKWITKVVPMFREIGITAEYWNIEKLESKLMQYSEVRDVFFEGENRMLVGLKEAHDLLAADCVGSLSLDIPIIGRKSEIDLVMRFACSGDKRVLPVVGPGGIGKSRLLYECLVSLADRGWRVLWALPGSMAKSSQWFRLLNGNQQTCVAIDDPDDPGLLRSVIEQLAAVERRNWRVVISYRAEKAESLRRYRNHTNLHESIELGPLDEPGSKELVNAYLEGQAPPPWLHLVYKFTNGYPGWLCLIAALKKEGKLVDLPETADGIAEIYFDSCLSILSESQRIQGLELLRWLALWGTLKMDDDASKQAEFSFLETHGIPIRTARELLTLLVNTGLVRNWGMRKRLYAVKPLIVRHQILSRWLLRESAGVYKISDNGKELVAMMIKGQIPAIDSILSTLSHLTRVRLTESDAEQLFSPIFESIEDIALKGNIHDQYSIVDLVKKTCAADPESALDVIVAIRRNATESMDVKVPLWGIQTLSHPKLVSSLPWVLFQIAEHVTGSNVARRIIDEFRQLVSLEDSEELHAEPGKGARLLFKRLVCEARNSETYASPACEYVVSKLDISAEWPFVGLVMECLLEPIRESTDWVANWTLTFSRRALLSGSAEWKIACDVRKHTFALLSKYTNIAIRKQLWQIIAVSHHSYLRTILHGVVRGSAEVSYREILLGDLTDCSRILKNPPVTLTVGETTVARETWEWYLEHGQEEHLIRLARDCEQIYSKLPISKWGLHNFFRFRAEQDNSPELACVADAFRHATGKGVIHSFFSDAKQYLDSARHGHNDSADDWRICELADACADLFVVGTTSAENALTDFSKSILEQPGSEANNRIAWIFVIRICKLYIRNIKKEGDARIAEALNELLNITNDKISLLLGIYVYAHPESNGTLTRAELDCVVARETDFLVHDWFDLLAAFIVVDAQLVMNNLCNHFNRIGKDPKIASQCMYKFIHSVRLAALRFHWPIQLLPVPWIMDVITGYNLNGALLGMYELEWLRDKAGFKFSMVQVTNLLRSRIEMEHLPRPSEHYDLVPHDFAIGEWIRFDTTNPIEIEAFKDFCRMSMGHSFIANYWMPKYISQIDKAGHQVAAFVECYLADKPNNEVDELSRLGNLASAYPDDSDAWVLIARPICVRANWLRRVDRNRVYFGLTKKETGMLSSIPGQVSKYYADRCDEANRLLSLEPAESPLRPYREWALNGAKDDLLRETGRAEEDDND